MHSDGSEIKMNRKEYSKKKKKNLPVPNFLTC